MMSVLVSAAQIEARCDEAWTPRIVDESADDRQFVVISRQQFHHTPIRRGENVMEARFARFIVRDAIKHHSKNLPYIFLIQPANEAERAKAGHRPPDEATKARLAAAKRARIEMHRTCRIDDAAGELCTGDTPAVKEHEGDTAMSKLSKKVAEGVKTLKKSKKAAPKKAEKKAAKKAGAQKPKREWFVVDPTGSVSAAFGSILGAAKSVGFKGTAARVIKSQHYTVTVDEKIYTIITPEAAKRDSVTL
jgi:hypothetical protein